MVAFVEAKRSPGAVEFNIFGRRFDFRYADNTPKKFLLSDLDPFAQSGYVGGVNDVYNGEKFAGGFGDTKLYDLDYWVLRERSGMLFTENLYARGLVKRLITNEINTGLAPESCPDEEIIGVGDDALLPWTETVENRFGIWGKQPRICDYVGESTFGAIQRAARLEALVAGDVLVVMHQSPLTKAPQVQLVSGSAVRTPVLTRNKPRKGHNIRWGVETDARKRVVAYHIRQEDGTFKRLPARGSKTGRKQAWLVFGTEKRLDEVRGVPLLGIVLQSLKEIDRYRDAVQRKAVVNSILAMFIKKTEDAVSSLPVRGGAVRVGTEEVVDDDGTPRSFNIARSVPGVVIEELQKGEEPVGFHSQGTDLDFEKFEGAVLRAIAWAQEMPPEILLLSFNSNYSASQAAINEFKIYLNKVWSEFGEAFCTPIYIDWLLSETLVNRVKAPGLLAAWRDLSKWDVFGAWVSVEWYGSIKPSTDMLKQAKGSQLAVSEGWSTNARETRNISGTKFSKNIKKLVRENQQKVDAARPFAEFDAKFGPGAFARHSGATMAVADEETREVVRDELDEYLEARGAPNEA